MELRDRDVPWKIKWWANWCKHQILVLENWSMNYWGGGLEAGQERFVTALPRVLKRRLQGWLTYVREWKAMLKENLFLEISTCTGGVRIHTTSSESKGLEKLWNYGDHSHQRKIQLFTIGLSLQKHGVTKFLCAPLFSQILAIPSTGNKDLNFVEMHGSWAWDWLNLQVLAEVLFFSKNQRTKCWFWKWTIHWERVEEFSTSSINFNLPHGNAVSPLFWTFLNNLQFPPTALPMNWTELIPLVIIRWIILVNNAKLPTLMGQLFPVPSHKFLCSLGAPFMLSELWAGFSCVWNTPFLLWPSRI